MFKNILATAILLASASLVHAQEYKVGDLIISHPIARETLPGAKVGGGYVTIKNTGKAADRLVGGNAGFAGKVEIHEMKMENQVMKMKPIVGGLEIPAGSMVKLAPGGNHLMFMKLSSPLKVGESHKATLKFENSGEIKVAFKVLSIADTIKLKGKHKMKMNH